MISNDKEQLADVYKEAGQRIFQVRNMRGYTRENLAALTGISPKFLYEIETGKKGFSAGNLYLMSHALKVRADYILFGDDGVECDQKLMGVLELFEQRQTDSLEEVLKAIYNLMSAK